MSRANRSPGLGTLCLRAQGSLFRAALLAALASAPGAAQGTDWVAPGFQHRHWTASGGLPTTQVTGWRQADDGFVWLSTFSGLVRFDGVTFERIQVVEADLPSVRFKLKALSDSGRVWIQADPGHLIEYRNGSFINHTLAVPELTGEDVLVVDDVERQRIFTASNGGLYELSAGRFVRVRELQLESTPLDLAVTPRGSILIGTLKGELLEVDAWGQGALRRYPWPTSERIIAIHVDPTSDFWVGGEWHLAQYIGGQRIVYPRFPMGLHPEKIHPPEAGQPLWIEASNGAWVLVDGSWVQPTRDAEGRVRPSVGRLHPDGRRWLRTSTLVAVDGESVMRSYDLQGLDFDHEGGAWMWGGSGLHRLDESALLQVGSDVGMPANTYGLAPRSNGGLWVTFLNTAGGGSLAWIDAAQADTVLASSTINVEMAVLEDRNGTVWVAQEAQRGGVCVLEDDDTCREVDAFGGRLVRGIFEDRRGSLWFGTTDGVYRRTPDDRWSYLGPEQGLTSPHMRVFADDSQGRVWMGSFGGGVAVWQDDRVRMLSVREGLSGRSVRSLHVDERDIVWIGTEDRGLNRLDPTELDGTGAGGSIAVIRVSDGLFAEGIHSILPDAFGRIWMSSNTGLFWIWRSELDAFAAGRITRVQSRVYQEPSGLLDRELNGGVHGAGIVTSSGQLVFSGVAGTVWVDPARIDEPTQARPPQILDLRFADQTFRIADDEVELPLGQRAFEVTFTAPVFGDPQGARFRYRLEGFDEGWVEADTRRSAFYTNVPPGVRRFEVEVEVDETAPAWRMVERPVHITIPYHWYEYPGLQASTGLLVLLMVSMSVRRRLRQGDRQRLQLEELVDARTRTIQRQTRRLQELDEEKNLLFQDISHELRTPVTLIIGHLEAARRAASDHNAGPTRSDTLDVAVEQTRRLGHLVEQILDLSRLQAGAAEPDPRVTEVNDFVQRVTRSFSTLADRADITLRTRLHPGALHAEFDPDQMVKVLSNLISNAFKFSEPGATVTVAVDERQSGSTRSVVIDVRDRGLGVPKDELPHLFDRFFRGRAARDQQIPGTGLGLSLSRRLVHLMGGTVEVESRPGAGSVFSVVMPLVAAPETPEPAPAGPIATPALAVRASDAGAEAPSGDSTPAPGADDRPLALIIDDHAEVRALLRDLLHTAYRVAEAGHAREALSRIDEQTPDIVLCDVKMPGMGADEFIRAMREQSDTASVPIMLVSARASVDDRRAGFEWGADAYVTKPFEPEDLLSQVDALIRSKNRTLEHARPVIHVYPSEVEARDREDELLQGVRDAIEEHLADPAFDVNELARCVGYSRSAFYRRLDELGVSSPAELIRQMRLERGRQLLEAGESSVSRVAWRVGFKSTSHFSKLFRDRFGLAPSEFSHEGRRP